MNEGVREYRAAIAAMGECEQAIRIAHAVLDRVNADPDDDLAVLARQLIRANERETAWRATLRTIYLVARDTLEPK